MPRCNFAGLALLLLATGCARLVANHEEPSKLPPVRMAPDSVVLEIGFARLPATDLESYEAIWKEADEQPFSPELRRDLAANGLRVGIIGQELPTRLRELLDAKRNVLEERSEDVSTNDVEISNSNRQLSVRAGRRSKILVSKTHPSLALLMHDNGHIHGPQLYKAQCLLALKTYPRGDGRVKLDITPEVEHGETKAEWVRAEEGSLMQRIGRERLILDRLRLETVLFPGQMLMLSTTADIKGLGEHYFAEAANGTTERSIVVIRLAQTQIDDLFAPEQIAAPLATPGE